jgi:hypothetical protein
MAERIGRAGFFLIIVAGCCLAVGRAVAPAQQPSGDKVSRQDRSERREPTQEPQGQRPGRDNLTVLSQEVAALKALSALDLTPGQMKAFAQVARETAGPPRERKPPKASPRLRGYLRMLHDALVDNDRDGIKYFSDKVDGLREAEDSDIDDAFEVTDAARARASDAIRLLSVRQVANYLSAYEEDLPDPLVRLKQALNDVPAVKDNEWQEVRNAVAAEVGWLVAGLNPERSGKVSNQVATALDEVRTMKPDEWKQKRPEVEKAIRQKVIGRLAPTDVLRHIIEHDLAELLSNPRLAAVIKARLQRAEQKKAGNDRGET